MKLLAISISCCLAILVFAASPAQACFVCDNNQCRELTRNTEEEIGFPNCIDGVSEGVPFCQVSGLPCITPPGGGGPFATGLDELGIDSGSAPACPATAVCSVPEPGAGQPSIEDQVAGLQLTPAR